MKLLSKKKSPTFLSAPSFSNATHVSLASTKSWTALSPSPSFTRISTLLCTILALALKTKTHQIFYYSWTSLYQIKKSCIQIHGKLIRYFTSQISLYQIQISCIQIYDKHVFHQGEVMQLIIWHYFHSIPRSNDKLQKNIIDTCIPNIINTKFKWWQEFVVLKKFQKTILKFYILAIC